MDSMGGILTKGLGASACNSLIYGPFRLKCFISPPPTAPVQAQGGGGPHIREGSRAAEIIRQQHERISRQNSAEQDEAIDERNKKLQEKRMVTFVFGFNEKTVQKEYIVDKDRANRIVNIVKFINKTTSTMSVAFSSFKRKLADIKIKFTKR